MTTFCQASTFNPLPVSKNMYLSLSSAVVIDLYICSQNELFSVCLFGTVCQMCGRSALVIGCMLMLTVYFFCASLGSVDPYRGAI